MPSIIYTMSLPLVQLYSNYYTIAFFIYNSREDFLCIPELAINPIGERIIDAFFMNEDSQ